MEKIVSERERKSVLTDITQQNSELPDPTDDLETSLLKSELLREGEVMSNSIDQGKYSIVMPSGTRGTLEPSPVAAKSTQSLQQKLS